MVCSPACALVTFQSHTLVLNHSLHTVVGYADQLLQSQDSRPSHCNTYAWDVQITLFILVKDRVQAVVVVQFEVKGRFLRGAQKLGRKNTAGELEGAFRPSNNNNNNKLQPQPPQVPTYLAVGEV